MAQTTSFSKNIMGANLIEGATAWGTYEHCGQDLLLVVARENAFPRHKSAMGYDIDDVNDLSFISGVYPNTLSNYKDVTDLYPNEDYIIYHGCMRGDEVCFYLS